VHGGYPQEPLSDATYSTGVENAVDGYPHVLTNRVFSSDPLNPSTPALLYNAHVLDFGLGDIAVTVNYNSSTRISSTTATVTSAVDIDGDYRLACVYTEDSVTGTGDGSNSNQFDFDQDNYYSSSDQNIPLVGAGHDWQASTQPVPAPTMQYDYVARTIQGGFDGQTGSLPSSMTAGGVYSYTFPDFTLPVNYRANKMRVHVLLIDATNGIIMNANGKSSLVGISDPVAGHYEVSVYPNPATDQLYVELNFKESDKATLTITDVLGKVCMTRNLGTIVPGEQRIPVNTSNLSEGTYFLTLTGNNGSATTKFIK